MVGIDYSPPPPQITYVHTYIHTYIEGLQLRSGLMLMAYTGKHLSNAMQAGVSHLEQGDRGLKDDKGAD